MGKENEITTKSYAIDCNDESRLLADLGFENDIAVANRQHIIPSTAAIYSLFSENKLFLSQD